MIDLNHQNEPSELDYIEDYFKGLSPKAVQVVGREEGQYRITVQDPHWRKVIGLVTGTNLESIRRRAKYRIYKELSDTKKIIFCQDCGTIVGCRLIDGFNRPWENICNKCFHNQREENQDG